MLIWDPSSIHRALSSEFLTPIADRLWRVQRKVSKHLQLHEGDNDWVAGCTAYQRRVYALTLMARDDAFRDWLSVGFIDGQFCIKVLGFPIRIYRAPEEGGIPDKYMTPSRGELTLLGALPEVTGLGHAYRLEVVAKTLARPLNIRLVELNEFGAITNFVTVPRSRDVDAPIARPVNDVQPIRRKPTVFPPRPAVGPNERKQRPDDNEKEKPA